MKYVAIDMETTGLDPRENQVLAVALVLEDSTRPEVPVEALPYFECLVSHVVYAGDAYALQLNAPILKALAAAKRPDGPSDGGPSFKITDYNGRRVKVFKGFPEMVNSSGYSWEDAAEHWLGEFMETSKWRANAAGKNAAGFDLQFLRGDLKERFRHRVIDPGSVFVDWSKEALPSLSELKKSLGMEEDVAHDALADARDVIRTLRRSYSR